MSKKSLTKLTLENGLLLEIKGMPIEKYSELLLMMESNSEEKIYLDGMGYFFAKSIRKISRDE